jgi:hypothetical protein
MKSLFARAKARARSNYAHGRANILAQLPSPQATESIEGAARVSELTDTVAQALEGCASLFSPRLIKAPKRPNDVYNSLLRTTQKAPIPPQTRAIITVMRALEDYNEHARAEMRELNRQSQRLDESGEAHVPAELVQEPEGDERRKSVPESDGLQSTNRLALDVGMEFTHKVGGSASAGTVVPSSVNLSRDPRLRR